MSDFSPAACGARIRMLRKYSLLSQGALSRTLGISIRHLQRLEAGENMPSIDLLIQMAEYFSVSLDFLVLGKRPALAKGPASML